MTTWQSNIRNCNFKSVADNLEGLRAVSTGQYDAMVLNQMYATYLIENQGISNLTIAGESGYLNRLSAAVSINDPLMFSIVDKSVDRISPVVRRKLYQRWLGQETRPASPTLMYGLLSLVILALMSVSILWLWNRSLKKQVKRRTRQIINSRENLRTTLNSIGWVITTETGGLITAMNPVAEELTGWTEREAINKPLTEIFHIIHTITRQPVDNPAKKVLTTNQIVALSDHTTLIARGGREYQVTDSGAPIMDKKGNIFGVVLVFRNVTKQKRSEDELLKMQKLKSIGTLAGGIAHDFNNILMGLYGNISLALDDIPPDHSAFQSLETAEKSLNRAS